MKTHRIILPRDLHQQALAGVGLMVLPMKVQPQTDEVPGVVWFHVGDRTYGGKRAFAEDGCQYKQGDRLALLEPVRLFYQEVAYEYDMHYAELEDHYDAKYPASRLPLRLCRCFYRVLAVETVLAAGKWAWCARVEALKGSK